MSDAVRRTSSDILASLMARGESAERSGDLEAARGAYVSLLEQLPLHVATRRKLAAVEERLGDGARSKALRQEADMLEVEERLALARNLIGSPLEAKTLAMAEKVVREFPASAAAQYGHAELLRRNGQLDEAVAALHRGLDIDASHEPARALLDTLEQRSKIGEGTRPTPFRLMPNFLDAARHRRLLEYALANEAAMLPSAVESATPKPEWRRSRIVPADPNILEWFAPLVAQRAAAILADFGHHGVVMESIGLDWVASNDGDFYKNHVDTGPGHYALRTISFVYYFNRQPKGFSGGELALYDTDLATGEFDVARRTALAPLDNRLVLFPSAARHEILPVRCPSRDFADSRFTLNGWIRRAP
ncbi:MAG: 2OG-Fe(II) oxygenase [Alphaproteobacteria bacterium]